MSSFCLTILGCGTSLGVPVPACSCQVCSSPDPRDQRLRTSAWLTSPHVSILIDCGSDFRTQALRAKIQRVDAVFLSHSHADHILGFDDLRAYNFAQQSVLPVYGTTETLNDLKRSFWYAFEADDRSKESTRPRATLVEIEPLTPVTIGDVTSLPIPLQHGAMAVLGFRWGPVAYLTDVNSIPMAARLALQGVKTVVISGLRDRSHSTHFTIDEAAAVAADLGVRRTIITHMSHEVSFSRRSATLPPGVELGFDGLQLWW